MVLIVKLLYNSAWERRSKALLCSTELRVQRASVGSEVAEGEQGQGSRGSQCNQCNAQPNNQPDNQPTNQRTNQTNNNWANFREK